MQQPSKLKRSVRQLDSVEYISTLQEDSYLPALWEVCHINHRQFISHLLELEYLFSCTRDRVQDVETPGVQSGTLRASSLP